MVRRRRHVDAALRAALGGDGRDVIDGGHFSAVPAIPAVSAVVQAKRRLGETTIPRLGTAPRQGMECSKTAHAASISFAFAIIVCPMEPTRKRFFLAGRCGPCRAGLGPAQRFLALSKRLRPSSRQQQRGPLP